MDPDEPWHGTRRGYDQERCRCRACKDCKRDSMRAWRAAKREGRSIPHWWRDMVHGEWFMATQHWWELREASGLGYAAETAEFEADHPAPRFRDFLVGLSRF